MVCAHDSNGLRARLALWQNLRFKGIKQLEAGQRHTCASSSALRCVVSPPQAQGVTCHSPIAAQLRARCSVGGLVTLEKEVRGTGVAANRIPLTIVRPLFVAVQVPVTRS